ACACSPTRRAVVGARTEPLVEREAPVSRPFVAGYPTRAQDATGDRSTATSGLASKLGMVDPVARVAYCASTAPFGPRTDEGQGPTWVTRDIQPATGSVAAGRAPQARPS